MKNFKKFAMLLVAVMAVGVTMTSCSNEDETIPVVNNVRATETLSSIISADKTLYSNVTYQLSGKTYVTNGATLTIQPGTRIEGLYNSENTMASALIITRGCKIMAQGTADKPIVFQPKMDRKADGAVSSFLARLLSIRARSVPLRASTHPQHPQAWTSISAVRTTTTILAC